MSVPVSRSFVSSLSLFLGVVGCLFHIITTQPAHDGDDGGEEGEPYDERDGARARVHYVASEESGTVRRGAAVMARRLGK